LIDVSGTDASGCRWIGELKLWHTDQILWDLLKVADGLRVDGIGAGFLQVGAPTHLQARSEMCNELLQSGEIDHDVLSFFRSNRGAWSNLLRGGTARPLVVPHRITTTVLADPPILLEGRAARLILVAVNPDWSQPIGMDPAWWCGDWPPGVSPHKTYVDWRGRHCRFLRALDDAGPMAHEAAQALSVRWRAIGSRVAPASCVVQWRGCRPRA
jgi:hypothetical protein